MSALKKSTGFYVVIATVILAGPAIWLGQAVWKAELTAKFLSAFQTLQDGKSKMSTAQVEALLGQPTHIEHAEATGITGDAYHYPTYPPGGDLKVVFVNGVLNHTELPITKTP